MRAALALQPVHGLTFVANQQPDVSADVQLSDCGGVTAAGDGLMRRGRRCRGRSRMWLLVPRRGRSRACTQAAAVLLLRHGLRHVRRRLGEQALHKNGCISERLVMLL